jgi:hypothetical protein
MIITMRRAQAGLVFENVFPCSVIPKVSFRCRVRDRIGRSLCVVDFEIKCPSTPTHTHFLIYAVRELLPQGQVQVHITLTQSVSTEYFAEV